jgi:HEAT repeat protein
MSAHAAAPSILKMVVTPKTVPTLQMEGVVALGQLRSQAALDVLLELGSASWPTLRSAALVAIARIDPETFIGVLAGLDPDPHWSVRAALAGALGELPGKLGEARLTTMLTDDDQRVIPRRADRGRGAEHRQREDGPGRAAAKRGVPWCGWRQRTASRASRPRTRCPHWRRRWRLPLRTTPT